MRAKRDTEHREALLRQLEGQYGKKLYHLCMVYHPYDRRLRDELYSDVLYRIWRSLKHLNPAADPWPWIFSIASRAEKTMRRRRVVVWQRLTDTDAELPDSGATDNAVVDTLYRLIDRLGQTDRELIFLYLDNMPQHRIAAMLGTNRSTVASRIAAIKKKLKKIYEDEQEDI